MRQSTAASTALEPISAPPVAPAEIGPLRVLLIEDNPEAAELIQIFLAEQQGKYFCLEWSDNLVHAMKRLAEPGIQVVLLDLGLPELSGYKSFVAIEAVVKGSLPVVILTSDSRRVTKEITMSQGASDYLLKQDISAERLTQAITEAVKNATVSLKENAPDKEGAELADQLLASPEVSA